MTRVKIIKRGNVIAPADIISQLPNDVFKVRSWQNGVAVKTQTAAFMTLRASGFFGESVLSNRRDEKGRVAYVLFVYRDRVERLACFTHASDSA